ncbi:MAG: T9SS type A sorting domain-containing protein, partial [Desulfobacterales bacterium]|nr:T9SS type A sorting domain-containing protein [Desulfobacterales bacterium]
TGDPRWELEINTGFGFVKLSKPNIKLYPNPVSDYAKLKFTLDKKEEVSLSVYSVTGKKINNYITRKLEKGENEIEINTSVLGKGIYFYRLGVGGQFYTGKIIVAK